MIQCMVHNNEAIQVARPIPLLTVNPNIRGIKVMAKSRVPNKGRICQVEGCEKDAIAREYCKYHHAKALTHGIIEPIKGWVKCSVDGCETGCRTRGYCSRHYTQIRLYGKLLGRTNYDPNEYTIKGDKCLIQMYNMNCEKTKVAVVDAGSFELVKKHKWYLDNSGYVTTRVKAKLVRLSRLLMEPIPEGHEIDHKDRNPLNNRMSNLRYATSSQNKANKTCGLNTSGFKGVCWDKARHKWVARISRHRKHYHIGRFDSIKEAALAYNEKAVELFGEFALLNKVG
jgi:hypothetical protein